jgi:hypothetical protein
MNGSLWRHVAGGNKRRNGGTRALRLVAALGAAALAACGSIQASGSGAGPGPAPAAAARAPGSPGPARGGARSSQPALCRDAATVTRLEIVRNHGIRVPEPQSAFPNQVTVTDPALVRAVARALCGLPDMPHGLIHCPALLLGTAFTLHFSVDGRPLPLVTIDATGCEAVSGVGPVRRVTSPGFWQVLAKAAGGESPLVFGGDHPGPTCEPPSTQITKINGCPGVARPGAKAASPAGAAAS